MKRRDDASVNITSARPSKSADIRSREVRYLISMGVRTACFVLAIVVDGPLRWILIAASFVLPYFAVVIANTANRTDPQGPDPFTASPALELGSAWDRGSPLADEPRHQGS
jgi:Protein of unknown function (DUF3099)